MNQVSAPVPPITSQLLSKGRNTVGHETNLARSPLWNLRKRAAQLETVVSPVLYGRPFRRVAGSPVTTADQRLFAYITTMFVRAGCPEDRKVPFSLGDAAIAIGYDAMGGKQRNLVRQSLARLGSVMLESAVRHPDGHETVLGWGLIDSYLISTRGRGRGWVTISEAVSLLLREGSVTFLHGPTWNAITDQDDVAGRLWSFLESENLAKGWRYSLFPSETGNLGFMPTISEVVMLPWASRKEVAKRVRKACQVIETHDRRYRLEVRTGQVENSWVLHCSRTSQPSPKATGGGLPDHLLRAWRDVYKSHLPSARQKTVLLELLERHTSEWIIAVLKDGRKQAGDPFRYLLEQDRAMSERRLGAAAREEERWEGEKHQENAEAEQSLAELLLAVDGIRTTRR